MDNLRDSLGGLSGLLPVLLLLMVILGDLMFFATRVFPALQDYNALTEQIAAANVALSQQSVEQIEDDPIGLLNGQIANLEGDIAETATVFLTDNQGDSILDRLYAYSDESGVDITNLQLQQSPTATEGGPSSVRQFRLQVEGPVARLMNYIMRIRGAVLPTLQLANLNITETNGEGLLTMDVAIYVSPYSDGAALDNLPPIDIPAPPMPTAVPVSPEIAPADGTPAADASGETAPVSSEAVALNSFADPAAAPSAAECPGAPASWFQVGDMVVVDFNGLGALRLLDQVGGGAYQTLRQAYDNQVLPLLEGPACGPWREGNVWYWYTEVDGVRGWAAEASTSARWMCPQDTPECA